MLTALARAIGQLPERELRAPLVATLFWTVMILAGLTFAILDEAKAVGREWDGFAAAGPLGRDLLALAGEATFVSLVGGALWLSFVVVENAILFLFADRIITAVERRFYPFLPGPRRWRLGDTLAAGFLLVLKTGLANIVALPLYLVVPGANVVLFLALNGYLFGRGYYDLIALRRMDGRESRRFWRFCRGEFFVIGVLSVLMLGVPILNLIVPLVGLATAVHLFARPAGWDGVAR